MLTFEWGILSSICNTWNIKASVCELSDDFSFVKVGWKRDFVHVPPYSFAGSNLPQDLQACLSLLADRALKLVTAFVICIHTSMLKIVHGNFRCHGEFSERGNHYELRLMGKSDGLFGLFCTFRMF